MLWNYVEVLASGLIGGLAMGIMLIPFSVLMRKWHRRKQYKYELQERERIAEAERLDATAEVRPNAFRGFHNE